MTLTFAAANRQKMMCNFLIHVVFQLCSWLLSAYIVEQHPAVHDCSGNKYNFLLLLGFVYVNSFIIGFVPFFVNDYLQISTDAPPVNDQASAESTNTRSLLPVSNCSNCICSSAFKKSNIQLLKKRVFCLSVLQSCFFPIWLEILEHGRNANVFSLLLLFFLIVILIFLLSNLKMLSSQCTTLVCLFAHVLMLAAVAEYTILVVINICAL